METQRTASQPPAGGAMAIEASIQQPNVSGAAAQGYWPAFWTLGAPFRGVYTNWPSVGEIDILEDINGQSNVFGTLHCGISPGGPCNETTGIGSGAHACPGCLTGYHTYRIEFDKSVSPQQLRWYLDGSQYFTVNANQVDATTWANATNHGFFIILNVAMGGGWPGNPTGSTASGVPMNVDYVRVYYSSTTPTNTPSATATLSGSNLALNKPATSSSNENSSLTPNLAVDGNTGTRWSSAFSDPQWIQVDLGATTSINRVRLNWEAAYATAYQIQTSNDGSSWTTIYSTTSGNGGLDDLTGLSGSGRYVRMYGTTRATPYGDSLWEFEVYGSSGPAATATRTPTRTNTSTGPTNTPTQTATRTNTPTGPTLTPTRTNTLSGVPAWAPWTAYTAGQLVTYNGSTYKCIQSHTSQPGWEPPKVPALWQLQ